MRRTVSLIPAVSLLVLASLLAQGTPPPAPLNLVSRDARRTVPTTIVNGQEMIALDEVASLFQVTVREDTLTGGLTVSYRGQTIVVSAEQAMASVSGRVVSLPAPAMRVGNRWFVPLDFLPRALALIHDARIDLRRPSRLLIVGDVRVPRVTARIEAVGPPTRATLEIAPAAPVTVTTESGRLVARIEADALDFGLPAEGGGLIDAIRAGDQPTSVVVMLDERARTARATPSDAAGVTRVAIEVLGAASADAPGTTAAAAPAAEAALPLPFAPRPVLQTIVIDPGHGGDDAGVRGPGGTEEKQLTLAVARRLRALIETRLGVRVVLTRDDDRRVTLDERSAVANNNKADLFLSLHFNAAPAAQAAGAEVLYFRLDRDGEEVRRAAATDAVSLPVLGGASRTIDVISWDLAQARHLDDSTALAGLIADDLRRQMTVSARARQQAPLRVLTSVNMPAALIEMAYLSNPAQERLARSEAYQTTVAQAVYNAIVRFRAHLEEHRVP